MAEETGKPEPAAGTPPSDARRREKNRGAPPAVAAVRMEGLVLWVIQRVEKFPRSHKFTIGDRWVDTCLDVQTSLVEATYVRDKRGLLLTASRGLVRARVLVRMATALRCTSLDQEAHFGNESTEIGRMVGGWLRSLAQRQEAPNVREKSVS